MLKVKISISFTFELSVHTPFSILLILSKAIGSAFRQRS